MITRRTLMLGASAAALAHHQGGALTALAQDASKRVAGKKDLFLMNRIAPSTSDIYTANSDGSNERKLLKNGAFDYNASFSPDGRSVVFTSERNGDGNSDVFRARIDGSDVRPLATGPSVDDAAVLSPDGTRLAFVSTRNGFYANVWVQDVRSGRLRNVTGAAGIQGEHSQPNSFLRPSWSPDGQWLAISSDRNSDWRGHNNNRGWEHIQELSIYVVRADGTGFRRVASKEGFCLGSPKWSPDGRRVAFYEMTAEDTWAARRPNLVSKAVSQIISVDVATGDRTEHTKGPGLKLHPQYLSATEIGYLHKGGPDEGIAYTSGQPGFKRAGLRAPVWSADGKTMLYEKHGWKSRDQMKPLYGWDPQLEYRFTDVFPVLARDGTLAVTWKQQGNSSLVTMKPDGSNRKTVFNPAEHGYDPKALDMGLAGAFQPTWSPDSLWLAFGVGHWFFQRNTHKATIMRIRRDGTGLDKLTDGTTHCGFPSYSADGRQIVFREWGATPKERGLRIMDVETKQIRVLTNGYDNLPDWSPNGQRILFTRKVDDVNYDIFTMRPDGSDLLRVTSHRSGDGHAVWSHDGRILWNGSRYGFRDEAALYDNTFQQYGQILIMNADGSGKRMLTDSKWEDAMPVLIPAKLL